VEKEEEERLTVGSIGSMQNHRGSSNIGAPDVAARQVKRGA